MRRGSIIVVAGAALAFWNGCRSVLPHEPPCGLILRTDAGTPVLGDGVVGASVVLQVPVRDSADVDETVLGASFAGPDAAAFSLATTFPLSIPAGTVGTIEILFTPVSPGLATATLALQTMSMGTSYVTIEAEGESEGRPGSVVATGSPNLGSVAVGLSQVFSLSIVSAAWDQTIVGAYETGSTDSGAFTIESTFPSDLTANVPGTLQIRFAPARQGFSSATIAVQTMMGGPYNITVVAVGLPGGDIPDGGQPPYEAADCGLQGFEYDAGPTILGEVPVGQTQLLPLQVEDSADVNETILSAIVTGPDAAAFTVESTFPMSVPAGMPVSVELQFAPRSAGNCGGRRLSYSSPMIREASRSCTSSNPMGRLCSSTTGS